MGDSLTLSPLAWIVLIYLGIFIILLNLSLIIALRKRTINPPRLINKDTPKYLRNPWHKEDAGWQELSQKVSQWKEEPADDPPDSGSDRTVE